MKAIEEILREIRELAKEIQGNSISNAYELLMGLADRLEAAHKREREATCKESLQVGNAAALRVALEEFVKYSELVQRMGIFVRDSLVKITTKAREALKKPPRNCDVMDWRTAWAKWRTELHTQKPCGYAEVVSGTEQFMDWYMSEAKGKSE
jgi:hypothetical protein